MHSPSRCTSLLFLLMLAPACGGGSYEVAGGAEPDQAAEEELSFAWNPPSTWDVRGTYALRWDDQVTVTLRLASGSREATASGFGGVVDFGLVDGRSYRLDLRQFCARPEVVCPHERFTSLVGVEERNLTSRVSLRPLEVYNLAPGGAGGFAPGAVDHDTDRFLLGLGTEAASGGSCALLQSSVAYGHFARSTATGPVVGIDSGVVAVGYAGACAFGPAVVGATVLLETGFTAARTGGFSAP